MAKKQARKAKPPERRPGDELLERLISEVARAQDGPLRAFETRIEALEERVRSLTSRLGAEEVKARADRRRLEGVAENIIRLLHVKGDEQIARLMSVHTSIRSIWRAAMNRLGVPILTPINLPDEEGVDTEKTAR